MQAMCVKVLNGTILGWEWERNFIALQELFLKKLYFSAIDN